MANTPRLQSAVQKVQMINQAIVIERYCSARKAFVHVTSAGEFAKRAGKHCKDEALTGQRLSGAEITLAAECQ